MPDPGSTRACSAGFSHSRVWTVCSVTVYYLVKVVLAAIFCEQSWIGSGWTLTNAAWDCRHFMLQHFGLLDHKHEFPPNIISSSLLRTYRKYSHCLISLTATFDLEVEVVTISLNTVGGFHLNVDFFIQPTDFGGVLQNKLMWILPD